MEQTLLLAVALIAFKNSGEAVMQTGSLTPFTAEYEDLKVTKHPDGTELTEHHRGHLYRDSRGRMRDEFVDDDGTTLAMLWDPASGKMVAIDASTGKRLDDAVQNPVLTPVGRRAPLGSEAAQYRPVETSELGDKVIDGVVAHGRRIRLRDGTVSETWFAPTLPDRPIVATQTGPSGREESRLTNVRIGEPDPQLFSALDAPEK